MATPHSKPHTSRRAGHTTHQIEPSEFGDEEAATSWTEEKGKKESTRERRRGCDCEAERAVRSLASESEE